MLFVEGKPVGIIEAKKDDSGENITVVEGQSGRYAHSKFKYVHVEYYIRFVVSVLFIDKSNTDGSIMLIDASKLGKKVKEGKNQKTVLNDTEVKLIEDTFINQDVVEDFSVKVFYEQIAEKNYSFSAGQYFEVKIEYVEISEEEFNNRMFTYTDRVKRIFVIRFATYS